MPCCLFCCSYPSSSCIPLAHLHWFFFFKHFLALGDYLLHDSGSFCIISAPDPRFNYLFCKPWFLLLGNCIVNQDLGAGFFIFPGVSLLPGLLNKQSLEIYMCILTSLCTHTHNYFCSYPSVSILS